MRGYSRKMVVIMALSAILLCTVFILAANLIAENHINNQASVALEAEIDSINQQQAWIYNGEGVDFGDGEDFFVNEDEELLRISEQTFTVNYMWPSDFESEYNKDIFFNEELGSIYRLYNSGALDFGVVSKVTVGGSTYCAVLTDIASIYVNDAGEEEVEYEPVVLYVNVSTMQNLVRNLNYYLLPFMILAVVIMSFVGMHTGRKIEDSQRKLKLFFQNASHELKTPLQSIQGYAEGYKTGVIGDSDMAMDVIMTQSDKMRSLIDEILTVSKLESGEYSMKQENISISDILYDCLYLHESIAGKKGVLLVPQIPDDLPDIIGDEDQLPKVFNAVLSNAVRFAKNEICLLASYDKHFVTVIISDDGDGISSEDLPHIFERFYCGNKYGTGIGLSMSRDILKLNKGTIQARNGADGAEFIINLQRA